jgi:hypothetical protein
VLQCGEELQQMIAEYKRLGMQFFSQNEEQKKSFEGRDKYAHEEAIIQKKVNNGYLHMPGVKEFLKARPSPLPTCIFMS